MSSKFEPGGMVIHEGWQRDIIFILGPGRRKGSKVVWLCDVVLGESGNLLVTEFVDDALQGTNDNYYP